MTPQGLLLAACCCWCCGCGEWLVLCERVSARVRACRVVQCFQVGLLSLEWVHGAIPFIGFLNSAKGAWRTWTEKGRLFTFAESGQSVRHRPRAAVQRGQCLDLLQIESSMLGTGSVVVDLDKTLAIEWCVARSRLALQQWLMCRHRLVRDTLDKKSQPCFFPKMAQQTECERTQFTIHLYLAKLLSQFHTRSRSATRSQVQTIADGQFLLFDISCRAWRLVHLKALPQLLVWFQWMLSLKSACLFYWWASLQAQFVGDAWLTCQDKQDGKSSDGLDALNAIQQLDCTMLVSIISRTPNCTGTFILAPDLEVRI